MADPPAASEPPPNRRPRLSDAFSDELRKSVHKFETTRKGISSLNQRPRLSHAFADELRKSVHNLETTTANKYKALQRPKLTGAFTDELRKSVHDRQNHTQKKKGFFGRPKLSDAFTDELRQSVHNREEKSSKKKSLFGGLFVGGRKKDVTSSDLLPQSMPFTMSPVKEQKTPSSSKRGTLSIDAGDLQPTHLHLSPSVANKQKTRKKTVVVKSPVRSPRVLPSQSQRNDGRSSRAMSREMADSVLQNLQETSTTQQLKRRPNLNDDESAASDSKYGKLPEMDESLNSYASFSAEVYKPSRSFKKIKGKKQKSKRDVTSRSLSTFHDDSSHLDIRSTVSDLFSPVAGRRSATSTLSRLANRSILDEDSNILNDDDDSDLLKETEGDINAYRKDWMRLIRKKMVLKGKLATSRARNTLLAQQVDDLNAEVQDLKAKLERWKEKTGRLTEQQRSERIKFDNSSDLVTRAKVDLAKVTNENSKLKQQSFDFETASASKDRLVEDLNDTITRQADIIHKLSNKLKDQETTLRLSDDEKQRLEGEVAVLIAQRDGDEMRDTFRQLEEEREKFFWQREMDIEAKRIELEKQRDWILEQDKVRHAKDMERLKQDANREAELERERDVIQGLINQQLEDLKDANHQLRDKFARERNEISGEIKQKESDIAQLERDVLELQKQLSVQNRSKKDLALSKAETQFAKDDLRDMMKHKAILEKEIAKLKKNAKKGGGDPDGWKEIVFPGYRGVTFGSKESETLAGFLTILVEEKGKKSKKARRAMESDHFGGKMSASKKSRIKKKTKSAKKKKLASSKSRMKGRDKSPSKKAKLKRHTSKEQSYKLNSNKKRGRERDRKRLKREDRNKKKNRKQSKSSDDSIYIGNTLTLDENLDRLFRDTGRDVDIDDTSMLVFKRDHHRSSKNNRRSFSQNPSNRRSSHDRLLSDHRRRSRSNPPPEIILQ